MIGWLGGWVWFFLVGWMSELGGLGGYVGVWVGWVGVWVCGWV